MGSAESAAAAMAAGLQIFGGMEERKECVQRLMVAHCDKGTLEYQFLNLPKDHGVYFHDTEHPLMNALDYKGEKHVLHFGRCNSPQNPKNMITDEINKLASNPIIHAIPGVGQVVEMAVLVDGVKKWMKCDGCKCSPNTLKVWDETNEGNCLDGADGILNTSVLTCCYGGKIEVTEIPADNSQQDDQNQRQSKKGIAEQVPKAMADKINSLNESEDLPVPEGDMSAEDALDIFDDQGTEGSMSLGSAMEDEAGMEGNESAPDSGMDEWILELIEDMNLWYGQVPDFPQVYGISEGLMCANYAGNMCLSLPEAAINDEGYICDMSELFGFRMGGSSAAQIGGACAAEYNLLNAIGKEADFSSLIMHAERQQTVTGCIDQGPMAVSMLSARDTLKRFGVSTKPVNVCTLAAEVKKPNTTAILATAKKGQNAEYHTLQSDSKGTFRCLERTADVSTLLGKQEGVVKMALVVQGR